MSPAGRRPNVTSIPAGMPFLDALAAGLGEICADAPDGLAGARVLLPTRRACRALRDAFLRRSGGRPMLLPRLMPLGDVDEDELALTGALDGPAEGAAADGLPPAIAPIRRQLLMARLVLGLEGPAGSPDRAARLAAELARLVDQVQTERLDFADLASIVPDHLAEHWQQTLRFLAVVTEHWPAILADEGAIDPAEHRNRLLAAQARAWTDSPPAGPVIAAGSTGSVPASADLLAVVAGLPRGWLVLPGLDRACDDRTWKAIGGDPGHPQYGMKRLLDRLGIGRTDVGAWPAPDVAAPDPARFRLLAEALRPAPVTDGWRDLPAPEPGALAGLRRIDCPGPREEAAVIALNLRQALETPGRTAALITPDRGLARRVAAELARWEVEIDDSAGTPLAQTPAGAFFLLSAAMAAEGLAPIPLLAALKHPLAGCGMAPGAFRALVRRLETQALRGPRPGPGLEGLRAATRGKGLADLLDRLETSVSFFARLMDGPPGPLRRLLRAHAATAEALAATHQEDGPARLWADEDGETLADFVAELDEAADVLGDIGGGAYPALVEALMDGRVVRPTFGRHPRLAIWGPLEARLQSADLLVLGGLNEGTWPPEAIASPWMSRPMMGTFGLPRPERRIGLSAHDFVQGACAREVVLTRAHRVEGTPTVPSRWLLRLENLVGRLPEPDGGPSSADWLAWQAALDAPAGFVPAAPPQPRPPVAARPREMWVTRVETWMRDPYSVYARDILRLKALDPLDADPGAAEYGTFIHAALDAFCRAFPPPALLPGDAVARLLAIGRTTFGEALARPSVWAFWWPRFERVAAWFVETENEHRAGGVRRTLSEVEGERRFEGPAGPFVLRAKADRIDLLDDGSLVLIDYKTGAPPSRAEVAAGFAPQLPLEGAIAQSGGFVGLAGARVGLLDYWRLQGSRVGGRRQSAGDDARRLIDEAVEGLRRLIEAYDFPETPYPAVPRPDVAPRYGDYEHLARRPEWASGEEGEAE